MLISFNASKNKYKRVKAVCLIFALSVSLLSGACSRTASPEAEGKGGKGRKFDGNFRLYVTMGEDDPRTRGARIFADLVEEYSDGKLHCDVTAGTVLGSDTDLIKKVMADTGEVDIFVATAAFFAEYIGIPQVEIASLPYMLTDFETAWAYEDSDLLKGFEEGMPEYNMRVLTHFSGGFRSLTNSRRPIERPEDLHGLVIRTPAGSLVMDMLYEIGARAMPLPFDELNDALKKGYYDGQENPPSIIYYNKLYEAQRYLSITNHCYMLQNFTIAESVWQQLSQDEKDIILRAAEEAKIKERELVAEETDLCIARLKESGMEVNYPDLDLFQEATEKLRQEETEEYRDDYEKVEKWLADWRQ